ncbi:uncharacterized protein LOC126741602 [Anthonomus grandis grandis]|uniref:uncharacterized protein LOC126741602 n=1 Tax=Anthonomus grandis grandis TaxID=2921223 RepID=UPI0021660B5A|nr:uncharacterized protein LOC126741602 [Anthonomus grandis grandis]
MTLTISCRATDADKHDKDVSELLYHKGKLYSGGDDGKIKVWSADLVKEAEIQAHILPVFSLAASEDTLYSCSSDGSVKCFDLNTLKEKTALKENEKVEYWRVRYTNGNLYVGDNEGNVSVYKNNQFYGFVNVAEPIKDMQVLEPYVLTVQDSDLVITEFKLGGESIQWATDSNIPGRGPIALIGSKLFALIDRDGKEILLHSTNKHAEFKQLAKIVHGSADDRIINALCGIQWGEQKFLFSGGWDKVLKKWKVINDQGLSDEGSVEVDLVINSIAAGDDNQVYAAGSDGHIVRVQAS